MADAAVALITFSVRGEPTDFVFETIAFNILGTKSVLVPRGTVALPVIRSLSRRPYALQWPSLALCPLRVCHCTAQIVQIGVVCHRCIAESSGMMIVEARWPWRRTHWAARAYTAPRWPGGTQAVPTTRATSPQPRPVAGSFSFPPPTDRPT